MESRTVDILYKAENGIAKTEKCIKKLREKVLKKEFSSNI
ncbi:hypothetical protein JCM19300_2815 [Algibacter lectus]|uniref:Uncharacterized protein n=1 Tax=Algibacter lectus TaxID=221126 RepID=A0A090VKA2_9FLAO|nr:hypothetical protein JCM19300_2815 [Algibacter lectus]